MDFEHAAIALLASMVFVLAGMVGWLYWQQTRMTQNMNNIIMVVGELASARVLPEPAPVEGVKEEPPVEPDADDEDDRVSVDKPEPVVIEGPPAPATEDNEELDGKTKKELQEILTKRGIPFGKSDNKGALLSLLKATS